MKTICKVSLAAALFVVGTSVAELAMAAPIEVEVSGVPEIAGQIMVAVYDSEANFRKQPVVSLKKPSKVGKMVISLGDLPAGEYAVLLYHDQNDNGKLDTALFGVPTEPWGGSTNGKFLMGAPDWKDTRFSHQDAPTHVKISVD